MAKSDRSGSARADLQLWRRLKRHKENEVPVEVIRGDIHDYVQKGLQDHTDFLLDLRRAETLFRNDSPEVLRLVEPEFLAGMRGQTAERLAVRSRRAEVPLDPLVSFTAAMNRRAYQKQRLSSADGRIPENRLLTKTGSYEFAREMGIRVPEQSTVFSASAFEPREGVALKPANGEGSRGVYLIHSKNRIVAVKTGEVIQGFEALKSHVRDSLAQGVVRNDAWVTEEIIYEDPKAKIPARDFKFHSFYGRSLLVLEVVRDPDMGFKWWNRNGQGTNVGRHPSDFPGVGVPEGYFELANRISSAIPAPFMRIDLMHSHEGPVLGEFTGHPGGYEQFGPKWDRILGKAHAEAEVRLLHDLLNGKQFPYFS